jgi:hypothetical protein
MLHRHEAAVLVAECSSKLIKTTDREVVQATGKRHSKARTQQQ